MTHPANTDLHVSDKGVELITSFEGWFPKAYLDPVGVWTIGWGTTGKEVWPGRVITKAQGREFLAQDMRYFEDRVKELVSVPLAQHQFDALVSFAYNCGEGNLGKSSALRELNRGNYSAVPGLLMRYNTAKDRRTGVRKVLAGLTRRRKAEGALFMEASAPTKIKEPTLTHSADDTGVASWPPKAGGMAGEHAGPESGIEPVAEKTGLGKILKDPDTVKESLLTVGGLVTALTQLLQPIRENPVAAAAFGLVIVGLLGGLYVKWRNANN
jgi:lysozyme